ncbi:synaptonemal complex protein 2 isoform X2 [Patagioenas fasciata]|uniref:synaptonemal complex protein 2 isoform X2 n=1 Tax=Patagioenas fasciata TaxID=372321 RepID=UPI003A99EDCF
MVEFRVLCGRNRIASRIATLDFSRANFGLFKQLLGEIPWARLLEGKGAQDSWLVFRDCFYQVQDQSIPTHRKSRKGARRPAWLNRELLGKLKWKRRVYRSWKEGLATWEEYKAVVRGCREATRKAKASLELNLVRGVRDNRKSFFKYVADKNNSRGNVGPLMNKVGALVAEDTEKGELLNAFFFSVCSARGGPEEPHPAEAPEEAREMEEFALVDEDWVREQLGNLDIHKSMGPDGMHLWVLRELSEVIAGQLFVYFYLSIAQTIVLFHAIKIDLFSLYMVSWFEKVKGILVLGGSGKNEVLTSLAEDFFNMLLAVCDSRPEGKMQILENFVLRTCTLIADVRISIYVQQEVVRKLNLMLENTPRDTRKKLFSTKEMSHVMSDMGRRILDAGDYDLQVAITEALCRMISEKQRRELACQWFSMEFVSSAFKEIKDSEFETDCRKFLNQVNGMLGDKRRVFTYPCLSAALDRYELQVPLDENLEEFWIDFNVGSRSISFYVAAEDADHQWETVIIPEEEVELYSLEEKDLKKLLTIDLKSPINVGNQEGEKIFLYFDSILEIKDVMGKIYGLSKCKGFSKKQSSSVAKTTVHVVFDESGSQVLVPESQLSPCLEEKSEEEKHPKYKTHQLPGTLRTPNKNNNQEKSRDGSSKKTRSCKRKVSEASVLIPGTTRFSTRSPLEFISTSTPSEGRFKLPLEMVSSAERSNNNAVNETRTKNVYQEPTGTGQRCKQDNEICETEQKIRKSNNRKETKLPEKHMYAEEVFEMIQETENETLQKQTSDEMLDIVADSQPVERNNRALLSDLLESSFDKSKTCKKRACSVPQKNITTGDKQKLNPSLASRVSETPLHPGFAKEGTDVLLRKQTINPNQSKMKTKFKEITDATKSLINKISDRYKINTDEKSKARDCLGFNRSHLSKPFVSKDETKDRNTKNTTCLNITAGNNVDDVYNFNISGFDEPTIKLGIQESHDTELGVRTNLNKKWNADDSKTSTEVKGKKKTRNNQNKKHLFSDTDTEYRGDDSKTDVSWLHESNRKPKAQLIDYSRNKNLGKPVSTDKTADKFSAPACHVDKPKGKSANKKKINKSKKQNTITDETTEQTTRQKLPRRAALAKNYKEPSSSESESERQSSACASKEEKSKRWVYSCTSKEDKSKMQKHMNGKTKDDYQQKELQNIVSVEPRGVAEYVHEAKSENSAEKMDVEIPSSESPASLEAMRCAKRISDVTQEHAYSERSFNLQESTPEKEEMLNFEKEISPNNFHPQKKNNPSIRLNQSSETTVKKFTFGNKSFSPVLTEASLLSLTTCKTVSGKHAKGSVSETRDNNEDSSFRHCFSDTLSIKGKLQHITEPINRSREEDCVPPSPSSVSSGSKAQSWSEEPRGPIHESGPTIETFCKRRYQSDTESNSDEAETRKEEKKKRNRRMTLQPRKLFKTGDAVSYRVSESISTVSVNDISVLDGEVWEPGCSTVSVCEKLQKEFTKRIQSRSRKVDHFTKQSLRVAHEHLTTMSYQIHECRIRQLDRFHFAILEELENFEKDSQSLKNMEKEFSTFWKKHTHTFSTFMKNEQQRIQVLKTSFEKNIYHTVDYAERIFTSESFLFIDASDERRHTKPPRETS